MVLLLRLLATAILILPAAAWATELPALSCRIEQTCERGAACSETDTDFQLDPVEGGYSASLDAGQVEIVAVSPPDAAVRSFVFSNDASVSVLLSIFPGGDFALTVHEDLDGPYVETACGSCVEDM
jgi:hypothetical protein